MTGTRRRIVRLAVAVVFTLPVILSLSLASLAAPSAQEVAAAEQRLAQLGHEFEELAEQYNDAKYRLSLTERQLAEANAQRRAAEARADAAEARLAERAVQAYLGTGSQVDGLLGADSLAEFSDKLEFMGALAENDAALALAAKNARQQAEWAADRYRDVLAERQAQVDRIEDQLARLDRMIDEQEALAQKLRDQRQDYLDALAAQRAALEQAQQTTTVAPAPPPVSPPPVNGSAASIAVAAAKSVVGTQYVWGAADPDVGFDCSGLTMWSWAQAGVSLPHSSAGQYDALPHVGLSDVQPGDLIFYFSPISHVAIYVGGGQIVHARHPGPGGEVQYSSMYGYSTPVGAARPG
jgi:cell wall-associated NlpC family hydrolase